jgi:hypothetical protein
MLSSSIISARLFPSRDDAFKNSFRNSRSYMILRVSQRSCEAQFLAISIPSIPLRSMQGYSCPLTPGVASTGRGRFS